MKVKLLDEQLKFESQRVKVYSSKVELPDGKVVEWSYPDVLDGVAVIAIDSNKYVYLTKEWRIAWKKDVLQIPAGGCKSLDEEEKINQVHNELQEEIGMDAKNIKKLVSSYASAGINYQTTIYLATDLFQSKKEKDRDEFLEIIKMPFEEAYELFITGKEETTSYTIIAFLMAKQFLDKGL